MTSNRKIILAIIICLAVFVGVNVYSYNQVYGSELSREEQLNLPSHFHSVEDLEQFLAKVQEETKGVTKFDTDCDDRAMSLQQRALEEGCILSLETLTRAEYRQYYGRTIYGGRLHLICNAAIGNELWYIEPRDNRIWIGAYLD